MQDPGYLAGMLAGGLTESGTIGVVAAMPIPEVNRIVNAFVMGVAETNADATVNVSFINSFFDPATAAQAAEAQIAQGADVLFAERAGVIEVADENDLPVFGMMVDQQELAPDNVVTSLVWNMQPTVEALVEQVSGGTYEAQNLAQYSFMVNGGSSIAPINTDVVVEVPEDLVALVEERQAEILDGTFETPIDEEAPEGSIDVTAVGDRRRRRSRSSRRSGSPSASAPSSPTTTSTWRPRRRGARPARRERRRQDDADRIIYGLSQPDSGELRRGRRHAHRLAEGGDGRRDRHGDPGVLPRRPDDGDRERDAGRRRPRCRRSAGGPRGRPGDRRRARRRPSIPMLASRSCRSASASASRSSRRLHHDCRVLILDEPTAVLTPLDVDALFATVRRLRAEGIGVVFISHKLREVVAIADRVTVLRRGRWWRRNRPAGWTPASSPS